MMTDIRHPLANGAARLERPQERLPCRQREELRLQKRHLIKDGLLEANVDNFLFQQETEGGWVFAKSIKNDIFLFGPTLSDVIQQASIAEALLEHARHIGAGIVENTGRVSVPHWEQLEVA